MGPGKRRKEKEIDSGNPNPDTGGCVSTKKENLSLQAGTALPHVAVLGEVLWDVFEHSRRLGGAPLNFGVHARRLGHPVTLISALGADEPGETESNKCDQEVEIGFQPIPHFQSS